MTLKLVHASREAFKRFKRQDVDEDFTMRLFSRYTITFLAICSLVVTPRQFLSSTPLKCWPQTTLAGVYNAYMDRVCLINGSYILPPGEFVTDYVASKEEYIRWYAVTPLLIILQIVPFAIPMLIWATFNQNSGIEVSKAIASARVMQSASKYRNSQFRKEQVQHIVDNINHVDMQKKQYPKLTRSQRASLATRCHCCGSGLSSSYLTNLLIVVKVFYIIAVPINIAFITSFLGRGFLSMGLRFFASFSIKKAIYFEDIFPLRTICKMIAYSNNVHQPFTLQCLMTLNMYNEKLFLILWYGYLLSLIWALIDFIMTLIFRCSPSYRLRYFRANLPLVKTQFDGKSLHNFFNHYCSVDCCFALKLMKAHLDHVTMNLIFEGLIAQYMAEESKMKMNSMYGDDGDDYGTSEEDVDAALNRQDMDKVANMDLRGEGRGNNGQ